MKKIQAALAALAAFADDDDGPHVTFLPTPGVEQLGMNALGDPRVHAGACFKPDGKGGGKLYASAEHGAKLINRVRRFP